MRNKLKFQRKIQNWASFDFCLYHVPNNNNKTKQNKLKKIANEESCHIGNILCYFSVGAGDLHNSDNTHRNIYCCGYNLRSGTEMSKPPGKSLTFPAIPT